MNWLQQLGDLLARLQCWVVIAPWEQGVRVRAGSSVRLLRAGLHFKLPVLDRVYVQNTRLHSINLPVQTVTTKDGKTLTLSGTVGYCIEDMLLLYRSIQQPEEMIYNRSLAVLAHAVRATDSLRIDPARLEDQVGIALRPEAATWGLRVEFVGITDIALVRSYRLISDTKWWGGDRVEMDKHRQ